MKCIKRFFSKFYFEGNFVNILFANHSCSVAAISYVCCTPCLIFATRTSEQSGKCEILEGQILNTWYAQLFSYFMMAVLAVPTVVLVICNVVFGRALNQREKRLNAHPQKNQLDVPTDVMNEGQKVSQTSQDSTSSKDNRERVKQQNRRNYITMLMFLSLAYIICSCGTTTFVMIFWFSENEAKVSFFKTAAEIWTILNNSTNFIFYCMSGSAYRTAFRNGIAPVFQQCRNNIRRQRDCGQTGRKISQLSTIEMSVVTMTVAGRM